MSDPAIYVDDHERLVHRTAYPYVVWVEGFRGGRPVIEGTGFEVRVLVGYYYEAHMSVDEIVDSWPQISPAAVYSALAYYHDHKDEIDHSRYVNSYNFWQEHSEPTPDVISVQQLHA